MAGIEFEGDAGLSARQFYVLDSVGQLRGWRRLQLSTCGWVVVALSAR